MTDRQMTPRQSGIAESLHGAIWRKSSFSGTQGNCVEVATSQAGIVAVRDSKEPQGAVIVLDRREWTGFMRILKSGASA